MLVCPTVSEIRFYGCYHPCLNNIQKPMVTTTTIIAGIRTKNSKTEREWTMG